METIAARAWPAARQAAIGGWRLHASSGYSGRINACWPLEDPGMPHAQAIDAVEAWYAGQTLPPLFKDIEDGAGLTECLAARGYRPRTETLMMLGPVQGEPDPDVEVLIEADAAFEAVFFASESDPADARERLETLGRIPHPRIFACLKGDAIGAAAVDGRWVGVFAMRTAPAARRRGLARCILNTLLAAAGAEGASRAWINASHPLMSSGVPTHGK